jgi:hypothetical protein
LRRPPIKAPAMLPPPTKVSFMLASADVASGRAIRSARAVASMP